MSASSSAPAWPLEDHTLPKVDLISIAQCLAVAQLGSIRGAAAHLSMQQSVVSRRVRRLEDDLGVSLFERHSGGMRLTQAGARFLENAGVALEQLEHAVRLAGTEGRGAFGRLRLGVFSSLARGFLRDLLEAYCAGHPDVDVELCEGARGDLLRHLRDRRLDVVFLTGEGSIANCDSAKLWTERLLVALPDDHRLVVASEILWSDLAGERFVVGLQGSGSEIHDLIDRRLGAMSAKPFVRRRAVGREGLMHLVAMKQGVTLVCEASAGVSYPGVTTRVLAEDKETLPFSAIWSPANDNPALRRFISMARHRARR